MRCDVAKLSVDATLQLSFDRKIERRNTFQVIAIKVFTSISSSFSVIDTPLLPALYLRIYYLCNFLFGGTTPNGGQRIAK